MMMYWEMTQACPLACRHCRASATQTGHPLELSTAEGVRLLHQIASFGTPLPHLVLTGGDPLRRADLYELIRYGRSLGLSVSITPAASEELTQEVIHKLKKADTTSVALSLDASTADAHDDIRKVPGCYARTIAAMKWIGDADIPLQINTLLTEETADDLENVYRLLLDHKVMRWSIFFLISVGRGKQLQQVTPERAEALMNWFYDLSKDAPFQIKTTEAPFYRRVAFERTNPHELRAMPVHNGFGIRDGSGVCFVSHLGEVYPSGFLPLHAGNVREDSVVDIYRNSYVFQEIRDVDSFSGKCGYCEFRRICGGSRARAFSHTGCPTESDPLCAYQPALALAANANTSGRRVAGRSGAFGIGV